MKCPKCNFTSFDYFDTCPRCGKDMTGEKSKLNIFSIKPNPLFLLGPLTGDLNDSDFGLEAMEAAEAGAGSMELKPDEVYDDGSELDITIDEKTVSEPEDLELNLGDLGMSSDNKELDLNFTSDDSAPGMKEGDGVTEDVSSGADLGKGKEKESVQKQEPEKDMDELDLDSKDLELKIDFDDVKNFDEEPPLEQDENVASGEDDLGLPTFEEDNKKESVQKQESEKDMDENLKIEDLDSEDLELNLELDDGEDKEK